VKLIGSASARRSAVAAWCVAIFASATFAAASAPGAGPVGDNFSHFSGFDNLRTSGRVHYNYENGDFTVPQRFSAVRDTTQIDADQATGNSKQKLLHATGNVVVHQNGPLRGRTDQGNKLTERPSTLTCDKLDVDGTRKTYAATGNVHFTQVGGRDATSDTATLDDANHHLHMEGHVHVKNGEEDLTTDVLDYDTQSTDLELNGNVEGRAPLDTPAPAAPGAKPTPKRKKK
jgi:lipopolysaccharide assembly outer membrane protein LptD (OstA)